MILNLPKKIATDKDLNVSAITIYLFIQIVKNQKSFYKRCREITGYKNYSIWAAKKTLMEKNYIQEIDGLYRHVEIEGETWKIPSHIAFNKNLRTMAKSLYAYFYTYYCDGILNTNLIDIAQNMEVHYSTLINAIKNLKNENCMEIHTSRSKQNVFEWVKVLEFKPFD